MDWLIDLFTQNSVAQTLIIYAVVVSTGLLLGKVKIKNISLGVAGILFTGIFFAHIGLQVETEHIELLRDIGLVLFVYSIGLQVGPTFFSSLRKEGWALNLFPIGFVVISVLMALIVFWVSNLEGSIIVGIMSGAVTNTPGLGAAQQTLSEIQQNTPEFQFISPTLGYAVAYPLGVISPIFAMLLIRFFYKVNIKEEQQNYRNSQETAQSIPTRKTFLVQNANIFNKNIASLRSILDIPVVISRIAKGQEIFVPTDDTLLQEGDKILAVGKLEELEKLQLVIGNITDDINWSTDSELLTKDIYVTQKEVLGKTLAELNLINRLGFTITRIRRSGMQIVASPTAMLFFGDQLRVVGEEKVIKNISKKLGNSSKRLEQPNILPIFLGIILGVILGSIPFAIPFVPKPVKLGLAGGPLIVAILISRYRHIGKIPSYITGSSNLLLRELGMVFFLSSVGLAAGKYFVETLLNGGYIWVLYGLIMGVFPLLVMSIIARKVMKRNFIEITGVLAGSCTNPPALAFANSFTNTSYPANIYATIFPLATFLRIIVAQLLVIFLS